MLFLGRGHGKTYGSEDRRSPKEERADTCPCKPQYRIKINDLIGGKNSKERRCAAAMSEDTCRFLYRKSILRG